MHAPLKLALTLVVVLTIQSAVAQTSAMPAALPMPTGAFSFPPSADPLTYSPTLTFDVVSIRETALGTGPFNMGLVAPRTRASLRSTS